MYSRIVLLENSKWAFNLARNVFAKVIRDDGHFAAVLQVLRTIASVSVLFAIPHYTTAEEQGLWALFLSISALSTVAELGFSGLFTVFASHAKACGTTEKNEVASFSKFILGWSAQVAITFFPLIFVIGYFVTIRQHLTFGWKAPWVLFCFSVSLNIFSNFISAWFEGARSVARAYLLRALAAVFNSLTTILILNGGGGIWALPFGLFISNLLVILLILPGLLRSSRLARESRKNNRSRWFSELSPLFKKNTMSFIGGFLSFQSATILTYLIKSPEQAGKVGMTMNCWMAAFNVFYSMITASSAFSGAMWAVGDSHRAWMKIKMKIISASVLYFLASSFALLIFYVLANDIFFLSRLTGISSMAVLAVALQLMLVVGGVAVFTRSGKLELFNNISLYSAILTILVTYIAIIFNKSPYIGFAAGNFLTFVYLPRILKKVEIKRT